MKQKMTSFLLAAILLLLGQQAYAEVFSGVDGNISWSVDTGTGVLTLSGGGTMKNYSSTQAPWYSYNSYIKSVAISEGVTSIGEYAFYSCRNLTSVTIPEGVTSIGMCAFCKCESLTSVTIPEGVTSIERSVFSGCMSLTSVTIPVGVTSIKDCLFYLCRNLTSVTIPAGVTSIESQAFSMCYHLTSVTIPAGVTSIGTGAFEYCYCLTNMTIPSSVTKMAGDAFYCSGEGPDGKILMSVTMESVIPCQLTSSLQPFYDLDNEDFKIYVPYGSGDAYKSATGWSEYADKITEYCPSYAFQDGNDYSISSDYLRCDELTYTRTYTAGVWAAWYMPFDVVIDNDLLSKFEFAKLSGVLFEDDEWYIGAVKLKAGETVKALVPYLVKAKSSGEQTITAENTPLHAAADNGFSITSAENVFTFTGNCKAKTSSATDVGWYAMSTNGGFTRITKTGATMKGGRFFMTIADRSDNPYATSGAAASNFIRIREMGETTDVEEMMEMPVDETIYDLSGRRVDEPTESGIYIMNGKKIVIK